MSKLKIFGLGVGAVFLVCVFIACLYLVFQPGYLSVSAPVLECNPDKCASKRMLEVCGDLYLEGGLTNETWGNCMVRYSRSYSFLSVSSTDSRVWVYDVNKDCYIDEREIVTPKDNWRRGSETLDVVVACNNAWAQHVRNPSCAEATPRCEPSCPEWSDACATSRTCVDENCKNYVNMRSVNTCACLNTCGDGQCLCGETCGSCPGDCGRCDPGDPVVTSTTKPLVTTTSIRVSSTTNLSTTTTVFMGLPDPSLSSSPIDAVTDFFGGVWDWITGLF